MKLTVLKLNSLLVLAVGALLVAHAPGIPEVEQYWGQAVQYYEEHMFLVLVILGSVLVILGLAGFLPKLPNRSEKRAIRFSGEHGDVVIQLDSVQRTLTKIMTNMPEVRKVDVGVKPDKEKRRAIIQADVVLENQPDARARQTANVVTSYIAETAIKMLGLEDLATVNLKITDIHINPKHASESIRASRAAYEVGQPVGQLTHVEVTEEAPMTVNDALEPMGTAPDSGAQALESAGAMMAALERSQAVEEEVEEEVETSAGADEVETVQEADGADEVETVEVPEEAVEPMVQEPLAAAADETPGPVEMPTLEEVPAAAEEEADTEVLPPLGTVEESPEEPAQEAAAPLVWAEEPVEEAPLAEADVEESSPVASEAEAGVDVDGVASKWSYDPSPVEELASEEASAPAVPEGEGEAGEEEAPPEKKDKGGWGFV